MCVAFAAILFAVLRKAGALLQEAVVTHEFPLRHLTDGHELGAIPYAIAIELALVDLDAGQRAGLHLTLRAGVTCCDLGANLAVAQS